MNYYKQFRNYTMTQVVDTMLGMLGNSSDENLIRFTYLAEKLAKKDYYIRTIRWIRQLFIDGHPSLVVAKKIMSSLKAQERYAVGKLYRDLFASGPTERRSFEHVIGALCRQGLVRIQEDEFCKD